MMMEPIKNLSFFLGDMVPIVLLCSPIIIMPRKKQYFLKFSFSSKLGVDEEFDVRDTMSEARVQHR